MEKTRTQKAIDELMDQHGIDKYVHLLAMVAKELGEDNPYEFVAKEKDNFSKMLKEKRPLKHEFIVPLEKVFGVPMAKILYKEEYNNDFSKEDLPFIKGFRYYTYKDDPKLLKDEFDKVMITRDGDSALWNCDEFNMTLLDYVVQYKSANTLRHLVNKYKLKANIFNYQIYTANDGGQINLITRSIKALDYLIVDEDLGDVFNKFYDPYYYHINIKHQDMASIFEDELFIEKILNSTKIFESLFETKTVTYKYANKNIVCGPNNPDRNITVVNPLLNKCLNLALRKVEKYKDKAKKILEYATGYNTKALEDTGENITDLTVRMFGNVFYQNGYEWLTNIIYPEVEIDDKDLSNLILRLPQIKFVGI